MRFCKFKTAINHGSVGIVMIVTWWNKLEYILIGVIQNVIDLFVLEWRGS